MEAAHGALRVAFAVLLALTAAACGSSNGASCDAIEAPPASAELPTGASVDGGVVLPNGRTSLSKHIVPGIQLGHPVDMIANPNPNIAVVYVADARYGGGGDDVRCSTKPATHYRGIHVIDVDGRKEVGKPSDYHYGGKVSQRGDPFACPQHGTLPQDGAFGLAIRGDGVTNTTLYASSGISGYVMPFDVKPDGTLSPLPPIFVGGFTAGLALSPDKSSLFVVRFMGERAATSSSIAEIALPAADSSDAPKLLSTNVALQGFGAYNLLALPEGASGVRLWVSGFRAGPVQTVVRKDATSDFGALGQVLLSKNPEGIQPYGTGVVVALSDSDELAFLDPPPSPDTNPNPVITRDPLHVGKYLPRGYDFPGASPSALLVDSVKKRAFVTLATDDVVSVVNLEGTPSEKVINVGQAPSALALVNTKANGPTLVVANGKSVYGPQCPKSGCDGVSLPAGPGLEEPDAGIKEGCRSTPDASTSDIGVCNANDAGIETRPDIVKQVYFDPTHEEGTLALIEESVLDDPSGENKRAVDRVERPVGQYGTPCTEPGFPFSTAGKSSAIQHVVLIVRENKTYDFLLGALGPDGQGQPRNGRPELEADYIRKRYGWEPITPNLHALAAKYTSLDDFYADAEVSMQGHAWLTASFVNDYLERIHLEEQSGGTFFGFRFDFEPGLPGATPGTDSIFEHLIRNAIPFTIFGEADGIQGSVGDSFVLNHVDLDIKPNDKDSSDLIKADRVATALTGDDIPAFAYVLLPRDHTEVITADQISPVSLIAENDQATGMLIDRLSHSQMWQSTVVFLVEDDAQQGYDHVDYHRTICLVMGPFAKPDHNSSVHASFPGIFRTIEAILGIGPMNRFDAAAPILWDAFTAKGDATPFESTCAKVPLEVHNPAVCESPAQEEHIELDGHPDDEQLVFRAVTGSRYGTSLSP